MLNLNTNEHPPFLMYLFMGLLNMIWKTIYFLVLLSTKVVWLLSGLINFWIYDTTQRWWNSHKRKLYRRVHCRLLSEKFTQSLRRFFILLIFLSSTPRTMNVKKSVLLAGKASGVTSSQKPTKIVAKSLKKVSGSLQQQNLNGLKPEKLKVGVEPSVKQRYQWHAQFLSHTRAKTWTSEGEFLADNDTQAWEHFEAATKNHNIIMSAMYHLDADTGLLTAVDRQIVAILRSEQSNVTPAGFPVPARYRLPAPPKDPVIVHHKKQAPLSLGPIKNLTTIGLICKPTPFKT